LWKIGVGRAATCAALACALLIAANTGCGGDDDDSGGRGGTTPLPSGGGGGGGGGGSGGIGGGSGSIATAGTGNGGSGGSAGGAGSAGKSGSGGSGGSAVMLDDGGVCVVNEPNKMLSQGATKCAVEICPAQDSICVGLGTVQAVSGEAVANALADCDADNKCVPIKLVETMGKVIPKTCRSLNDAEGRCLSNCIPQVAVQKTQLPQDVCDAGELCAPCFDPRTGELTAACVQGCDPGPVEPAKPFPECCDGRGLCVSAALAGDQAASLQTGSCSGDAELCAPRELTDPTYKPASCRSLNDAEGRCLSTCVPVVSEQIDQLPTATCADDERCAPCFDPRTGDDTGACKINGDAPTEDAKTFTQCCSMRGFCVTEAQAGDQASGLVADSCTGGLLCAPKELTDPAFVPVGCDSIAGHEGRCLSTCVGTVAKQVDKLPTVGCAANEACAPCYDPITDQSTGACEINGDTPATHDAPFAKCCDNGQGTKVGVCVPPELAGDQAAMLMNEQENTCSGTDLCAPTVKAQDASYKFPSCTVTGGTLAVFGCNLQGDCSGACVPSCILASSQASQLIRGTCGVGELCAPCKDPTSGDPSGACD
jgi:hypothetical protein